MLKKIVYLIAVWSIVSFVSPIYAADEDMSQGNTASAVEGGKQVGQEGPEAAKDKREARKHRREERRDKWKREHRKDRRDRDDKRGRDDR